MALVGLVAAVRLEYSISGCTLDDSVLGMGSSLEAAKIGSDTSLVLEWGSPLEIGQALVKFHVRVGEVSCSSVLYLVMALWLLFGWCYSW